MSKEETNKFFDEIRRMDDSPDWNKINAVAKNKILYEQEIKDELLKLATTISEHRDALMRGEITVGPEFEDEPKYSEYEAINNLKRRFLKELELDDFISKLNFKSQRDPTSETDFLVASFSYVPSCITIDLPKLTDRRTKAGRLKRQVARTQPHQLPYRLPKGTAWSNITIKFISLEKVEITWGSKKTETDFIEMGFDDTRNKSMHKPNIQWMLLRIFARYNGEFTWENPYAKLTVPKQVEKLNKTLRKYFRNIDADPFKKYKSPARGVKILGLYEAKMTLIPPTEPEPIEISQSISEIPSQTDPFYDEEMEKYGNGI